MRLYVLLSDPINENLEKAIKGEFPDRYYELGYLLDSGDPYILWSTEAAFSVPPMMDLYGTGSMATACCTSR